MASVMGLYFYSISSANVAGERVRAQMLVDEGLAAAKNIRDSGFHNLTDGTYGIGIMNNQWSLV